MKEYERYTLTFEHDRILTGYVFEKAEPPLMAERTFASSSPNDLTASEILRFLYDQIRVYLEEMEGTNEVNH